MQRKESFYESCSDYFGEFIGHSEYALGNDDEEFKINCDREEELLVKYPNLRAFLEEEEVVEISKEERKALLEIITCRERNYDILNEEMFFKGMHEVYYLLKKMRVITDEREVKSDT